MALRFPWQKQQQEDPEPRRRPRFESGSEAKYLPLEDILSDHQQAVYQALVSEICNVDQRLIWSDVLEALRPDFRPGSFPENAEDITLLSGYIQRALIDYVVFHIEREAAVEQ